MKPRICIAGVTGFTGRLIASELLSRGLAFDVLGRDRDKLKLWQNQSGHFGELFCADFKDDRELSEVLQKIDLLINCVGPFNLFSTNICKLATSLGKDYFDISGEQEYVKKSYEKNAALASENGACIVHSMAFESCLADLMADLLVRKSDQVNEISSFYHFTSSRPSPGTRLTMQTGHFFPSFAIKNHEYVKTTPLSWSREAYSAGNEEIRAALFMPYPEVVFFKERFQPKLSGSFLLSHEVQNPFPSQQNQGDQKDLKKILERHAKRKVKPISRQECLSQEFSLYVRVLTSEGKIKINCLQGADMYGVTATIIAEGISHYMQTGKRDIRTGILSPAEFFGEYPLLNRLMDLHGIRINEGSELLQIPNMKFS